MQHEYCTEPGTRGGNGLGGGGSDPDSFIIPNQLKQIGIKENIRTCFMAIHSRDIKTQHMKFEILNE